MNYAYPKNRFVDILKYIFGSKHFWISIIILLYPKFIFGYRKKMNYGYPKIDLWISENTFLDPKIFGYP